MCFWSLFMGKKSQNAIVISENMSLHELEDLHFVVCNFVLQDSVEVLDIKCKIRKKFSLSYYNIEYSVVYKLHP